MKRTFLALALLAAIGCNSKLTGPTDVQQTVAAAPTRVAAASKASTKSATFDPNQLGYVTVTNDTGAAQNYVFIVWDATDEVNQVNEAQAFARLAAGETRIMTVGLDIRCGVRYQRDVYVGPDGSTRYTLSDLGNYPFYAVGAYWVAPSCDAPTPPTVPTPPVVIVVEPPPPAEDVCPNLEGVQATVPEGYEKVGQSCQPTEEHGGPGGPPQPSNVLFCHVDVNVTGGRNPKTLVHETQVGGVNGIPQSSIDSAHNAEPFHGVTTEHFYDYYGVCDGRGIGPQ